MALLCSVGFALLPTFAFAEPCTDLPKLSFRGKIDSDASIKNKKDLKAGRGIEQILQKNGYEVERFVAVSGFGIVYVVKNPKGERKIVKAAKDLNVDEGIRGRWRRFFRHEMQVSKQLHQKNQRFVAMVYKQLQDGEQLHSLLEMELVASAANPLEPAPSLAKLMMEQPEYFTEACKDSIRQQLRFLLRTAHKVGVIHLDLKPENILIAIGPNGEPIVSLIDWGLAQSALFGPYPGAAPRRVFGTHGFISPERLFREDTVFHQDEDVFALRYVEWYLRRVGNPLHQHQKDSLRWWIVDRLSSASRTHIEPSTSLPSPNGPSTIVHSDVKVSSNETFGGGSYREPGVALDGVGTEIERLTAWAEWTRLPKTVEGRDALIAAAQTSPPEVFLKFVGRKLLENSYTLPTEILSSHVLIENLGSRLKFSPKEIERTAKKIAIYVDGEEKLFRRERVADSLDPSPHLLLPKFIAEYDKIAKAKSLLTWDQIMEMRQQAKQAEAETDVDADSEVQTEVQ